MADQEIAVDTQRQSIVIELENKQLIETGKKYTQQMMTMKFLKDSNGWHFAWERNFILTHLLCSMMDLVGHETKFHDETLRK